MITGVKIAVLQEEESHSLFADSFRGEGKDCSRGPPSQGCGVLSAVFTSPK